MSFRRNFLRGFELWLWVFVLTALTPFARRAEACSRSEGIAYPSHFESVLLADSVVLARAEESESFILPGMTEPGTRIRFTVLDQIAGAPMPSPFVLGAHGVDASRSPRDNFQEGRRPGESCCCFSTSWGYGPGNSYILLLQNSWPGRGQGFVVGSLPREAEQVDDADAPWAVAVRHYARIAKLRDPEARRAQLIALRDLAARGEDPLRYPPALVADIEEHLLSRHPTKGFSELVTMFEAQTDPKEARLVLWSIEEQNDPRSEALFLKLLDEGLNGHRLDERGWATLLYPIAERAIRSGSLELLQRLVAIFPRLAPARGGGSGQEMARITIARAVGIHCSRLPTSGVLAVAASADDFELERVASPDRYDQLCEPAVPEVRRRVAGDFDRAFSGFRTALAKAGDDELAVWADALLGAEAPEDVQAAWLLLLSPGGEAHAAVTRRIEEGGDAVLAQLVRALVSGEVPDPEARLAVIAARLVVSDDPYPKLREALNASRREHAALVAPLDRALERGVEVE